MSRRRLFWAALLLASGLARAATLELAGVPAGARLAPGTRVVSSWAVTPRCEEAELVLSLDGGETFPLRLTPERDPAAGAFSFRVPNLPSPNAVVALRTGGDGERETIRLTSPEFVINRDASSSAESLVALEGELATLEAAAGTAGCEPRAPAGFEQVPARVSAAGEAPYPAESSFLPPSVGRTAAPAPLAAAPFRRPAPVRGLRASVSSPKRE